jgi:Leucine-rich repeat (LRR) protein
MQLISINYCEMDSIISKRLAFDSVKNIYLKSLQMGAKSLNNYINEFGVNLLEVDLSFNFIEFKTRNLFILKSNNLEKLWLAGVNVTNLDRVLDLTVFNKLILLDLSCNSLEIIEEHYFKFNYKLKHLNLSHNRIGKVEDYSLFNNQELVVLDLSYNEIEVLDDDMFALEYYQMRQLILNNNRLKLFSAAYKLLSLFESIRLDGNHLTDFPSSIHFTVKLSDELNLSGNRIGVLQADYFRTTNRIINLYLRNCSIFEIRDDTFEKVRTLIKLDLSQNDLKSLANSLFLASVKRLQILNLSSNYIDFISKELFQKLNRLTHLDLRNNLIQEIEDGALVNLNSLKLIYLEMNPVVDLFKNDTFTGLIELKHMGVSGCVKFSLGIVRLIKSQIKLRLVREVLYMTFYDSIELSFPPNFTMPYSTNICYFISYFIRHQILFNLESELFVSKFVNDCKEWSTFVYVQTLDDFIWSKFAHEISIMK